jgi:hypothetical protein
MKRVLGLSVAAIGGWSVTILVGWAIVELVARYAPWALV